MKNKMIVLICVLVLGISFMNREYTSAQSSSPVSKIGVVDIEKAILECNATKVYMDKTNKEIDKLKAEQDKLKASIQALGLELDSGVYVVGSDEFYTKNQELAEKQKSLNFLQDFKQSELKLKTQLWQIDLYNKILTIANEIGAEKDLYLVLAKEVPQVTPQNPEDFNLVISTHKVLYNGKGMDLTENVISRLNQLK